MQLVRVALLLAVLAPTRSLLRAESQAALAERQVPTVEGVVRSEQLASPALVANEVEHAGPPIEVRVVVEGLER